MNISQRQQILEKTGGLCHICGCDVRKKPWQADHVRPRKRGGENDPANFLPSCATCNRMKWHRGPIKIRKIIELGLYAFNEIKRNTPLGRQLKVLRFKRRSKNSARKNSGNSRQFM